MALDFGARMALAREAKKGHVMTPVKAMPGKAATHAVKVAPTKKGKISK